MSARTWVRPRSAGALRGRLAVDVALDPTEVARFVAERDEDATRERGLVIGQATMLLFVIGVVAFLVAVQRG